jgi:formylglycine-generating enzyme required for sulfatase activity
MIWVLCLTPFFMMLAACTFDPRPTAPAPPEAMVIVPAGWFMMGQDEGPRANQPQHEVYLDAFAIDQTEVTNAAFATFVAQAHYVSKGWEATFTERPPHEPVVNVIWREAEAYCRWAGKRLPTEAEWEKAARGADGRQYPWGNTWDAALANTQESGNGGPLPVGSFPAGVSPYGVLDMAGNVAEWVADYFDFTYYTYAPDHNPLGPDTVLDHGLRGGSWASPAEHAQTFFRDSSHSVEPNPRVGFRCAQAWPEEPGN